MPELPQKGTLSQKQARDTLALLGSLWTQYYAGNSPLLALVRANLELCAQQRQNLEEVLACAGRLSVPLYHTERRFLLELPRDNHESLFPKPPGLYSVPLLLNRVTNATRVLHEGIDYQIHESIIEFVKDPFTDSLISHSDDTAYLWGIRAQFDRGYVEKHLGYIYDFPRPTEGGHEEYLRYKRTINAIADCHVKGTTTGGLQRAVAAFLGVPLADGQETVLVDATDRRGRFLATTRNIYRIDKDDVLGAPVGSTPPANTPLIKSFEISEFQPDMELGASSNVIVPAGMAGGTALTKPPHELDLDSCIVIKVRHYDSLNNLEEMLRHILPPQTGLLFTGM